MPFWQDFAPASDEAAARVYKRSYCARMPDGSGLDLPLRDLGELAVAGMIVNQASFTVVDRLADWMAEAARPHAPEMVVGLPTLGHVMGAAVARALGHANWVAPGTSRKLWYEDELSVPLASITSPLAGRRMWLDPHLVARLEGRRVLLVDDVISTGTSAVSGLDLLRAVGVRPVALCVAMIQGDRWRAAWPEDLPLLGVFATPLFKGVMGGWAALPDTAIVERCLSAPAARSVPGPSPHAPSS